VLLLLLPLLLRQADAEWRRHEPSVRTLLNAHWLICAAAAAAAAAALLLLLLLLFQADAEWRRHEPSVRNIRQVVRITDKAVRERWKKYDELFDHVSSTVSGKFMAYMHRRGHAVRRRASADQILNYISVQAAAAISIAAATMRKKLIWTPSFAVGHCERVESALLQRCRGGMPAFECCVVLQLLLLLLCRYQLLCRAAAAAVAAAA
jgi:hypothetical protein